MLLELAIAGVALSAIKKHAKKKRLRLFLKPDAPASRRHARHQAPAGEPFTAKKNHEDVAHVE
jgi:hypothetical protein